MMDKLKFVLFSIVVLVLLGLLAYWSVNSMQSGSEFKTSQRILELQEENDSLTEQVADLKDKLDTLEAKAAAAAQTAAQNTNSGTSVSTQPTVYKNQTLINELQSLIASNVTMKLTSSGTRVGTVQKFLNIYNKTSNKIDNDYGAGTVKAVTAFQKDQGLTADGQAGPGTFSKMISWLKKQG